MEEKAQNLSDGSNSATFIKKYSFTDIIGKSTGIVEAIERAKKAARSSVSIFVYGDTGTGKELLAQSIHYESNRRNKPFLAQNCAALPSTLLEGILFGTSKGGFTGALDRAGLFEQADGGTLLLDEISAMPYELQSKLLRVLQEDYIRRIGGMKDIPVDVRIIATVNEPAEKLIEQGKLRKDLYYRLNVVNITIPPLRERRDDIELLAIHFINKHNRRFSRNIESISESATKKLQGYELKGNVRELENIIMQALSLSEDEKVLREEWIQIPRESLHDISSIYGYIQGTSLDEYLAQIEKRIIKDTFDFTERNVTRTAKQLQIKRQTLQHKLKKYNLI